VNWYPAYILVLIALRIWATPRDRNALSIILVASFFSTLLVHFVTHEITGAWKLAVPGAVEVLTITALMTLSPNRTGLLQSCCLLVAWSAHALCYLDIVWQTDIVYSRYETVLSLVAIFQIIACYDTLAHCGRAVAAGVAAVLFGGGRGLRHSGVRDSVLSGQTAEITRRAGEAENVL